MGRSYAGILGPLAFATVIARGLVSQAGLEETLLAASAALFIFAAIGYVVGQLAGHLVNESVRTQFQTAMAGWDGGPPGEARRQWDAGKAWDAGKPRDAGKPWDDKQQTTTKT